jgi:beta-lactamase class A
MTLRILSIAALAAAAGGVFALKPSRPISATSPAAGDPRAATLAAVAAEADGVVGVGALHVESGQRASVRGGERFPMASVYKLPIAIAFLRDVDAGRASLDQTVSYGASDLRPGLANSTINARLRAGKAAATVRELLAAMLMESDNTASDLVMRLAGGPGGVMARLREAGIEGMEVSRPEGQMTLDYWGVADAPPATQWSLETFKRLREKVTPAERRAAAERFASDRRDTAAPDAMATLLARLQKGELLAVGSTRLILDLMTRTTTGPRRIKGLLPAGTPVAHKTGTGGDTAGVNCCTNDVGIVTLPDGTHLAVAVFVRSSPQDLVARERAIARLARAAYDGWTARGR